MKQSEFRKLIREEVRKVLKEDSQQEVQQILDSLRQINMGIEQSGPRDSNIDDAIDALSTFLGVKPKY